MTQSKNRKTMSEEALRANRENAQYSTGAKTAEGKRRSARNRLKSGVYSKDVVMPWESQEEFQFHATGYLDWYDPKGPQEWHYTKTIINRTWELRRMDLFATLIQANQIFRDILQMELARVLAIREMLERSLNRNVKSLDRAQKERGVNFSQRWVSEEWLEWMHGNGHHEGPEMAYNESQDEATMRHLQEEARRRSNPNTKQVQEEFDRFLDESASKTLGIEGCEEVFFKDLTPEELRILYHQIRYIPAIVKARKKARREAATKAHYEAQAAKHRDTA